MPLVLLVLVTADAKASALDRLRRAGQERSGGTVELAPPCHRSVEMVGELVEVLVDPVVGVPGAGTPGEFVSKSLITRRNVALSDA